MEKHIEIDGLKIFYEETGDPEGSPVVIMHGWGCNHTTVRLIAESLQDGMRVINVDLPGHGASDEPKEPWDSYDFANCIKKLVEGLQLNSPSLVGHSFGGRTAIALASGFPVKKLVLVDSAGIKPKRSLTYYYKVYSYKAAKRMSKLLLGEKRSRKLIDRMLQKRGSADYKSSSVMMRRILSVCVNQDLKKIMPQIKCPTLLIWGENDTATPLADARTMEKRIPDAGLVSFSGCGHYSFLDNPMGFRAVIKEFFKEELNKNKLIRKSRRREHKIKSIATSVSRQALPKSFLLRYLK